MVSIGLLPDFHNKFHVCEYTYGPSNVKIHRGIFYFIIFIDDFSRYGYVYLIFKKSDALDKF